MTENYPLALASGALPDLHPLSPPAIFPRLPGLFETRPSIPSGTMLLGFTVAGLPLLLHLHDPRPGSILIVGDSGSGKTDFLKMLVMSALRHDHSTEADYRFGLLGSSSAEFSKIFSPLEPTQRSGSAFETLSEQLLFELVCRVQTRSVNQPTLLLVDGVESILQMSSAAVENFITLLSEGPKALIWPVVTANPETIARMPEWRSRFKTHIYGRILNHNVPGELLLAPNAPVANLIAGSQFCLHLKSGWLKFWRSDILV